jgi:hypothetical protein
MNTLAKWWLGLGLALVGVPLGFEVARWAKPAPPAPSGALPEEDRAAALAYSALHRCWLGEPLGPDEGAAERARKLVVATPPSAAADAWPGRCARLVDAYVELSTKRPNSWHASGDTSLAAAIEAGNPVLDIPAAMSFGDYWHREAVKLAPPDDVPAAPAPLTPVVAIGTDAISDLGTNLSRDRRGAYWSVASRRACVIASTGQTIRCSPLPDGVGLDSKYPTVVGEGLLAEQRVTPKPVSAVVDIDTGAILASSSLTHQAAARADGTIFVLSGDPQELGYRDPGGKVVSRKLPRGRSELFDGHVVTLADRLLISPLSVAASRPVDLGPLPNGEATRLRATCRSGDASYAHLGTGGVLRHAKNGWSLLKGPADGLGLSCDERSVQLVTPTPSGGLGYQRCDDKGCEETLASPKVDWSSPHNAVVACPERAIWIHELRGGLWASVAKASELERATPQLLMYVSSLRYDTSSIYRVEALPVDGGALVIAQGSGASTVVRVGCDGKVSRVEASWTEGPLRAGE